MNEESDPNDKGLDIFRQVAALATPSGGDPADAEWAAAVIAYRRMVRELASELSDWVERLEHGDLSNPRDRAALREALLRARHELLEASLEYPDRPVLKKLEAEVGDWSPLLERDSAPSRRDCSSMGKILARAIPELRAAATDTPGPDDGDLYPAPAPGQIDE